MLTSTINKKLCPFLLEPFENCYCVKMDSQYIERAVNLCSNNFEHCEIYSKKNGNGNGKNIGNGEKKIAANLNIAITE